MRLSQSLTCNGLQSKQAGTAISAFSRTLTAIETAIISLGLQSISPRPHSLPLNRLTVEDHYNLLLYFPVLVGYTSPRQSDTGARAKCRVIASSSPRIDVAWRLEGERIPALWAVDQGRTLLLSLAIEDAITLGGCPVCGSSSVTAHPAAYGCRAGAGPGAPGGGGDGRGRCWPRTR